MAYECFVIPVRSPGPACEELNRFLRGHRVLTVDRQLVCENGSHFWAFCVEYLDGPAGGASRAFGEKKIDYKEVLDDIEFPVFARLRALRKELAAREGIPAYAVFTNEQLAQMVRSRSKTRSDLARIEGVGESRLEKFADPFLQVMNEVI